MITQTTLRERLMEHMQVLCKQIGARPTGTRAEQRAAEYVRQQLWALDVKDVREQPFETPRSLGYGVIPFLLAAALAVPLGRLGRLGKLLGGMTLLSAIYNLRELMMAKQPLSQPFMATAESQNVIAVIPPRGETRQQLFILAHLDSNKQRFMMPQPFPPLTRTINTFGLLLGGLAGVSLLWDALTGKREQSNLQTAASMVTLGMLANAAIDEVQPYVEGANDNASAVAVALELAASLKVEPLEHTEVTLLFTGSEETACVGIEKYLEQYAPPQENSYWIDLEMVGTGNLCYVTRHGLSKFSEYRPAPRITAMAAKVARQRPELRVKGKPMTIVEEVAPLIRRGYEAICIAGYDELGMLPNWHRVSDTLDKIEPETMTRAHGYALALAQEIDRRTFD